MIAKHGDPHAVCSLPKVSEASASSDDRPRALLSSVRRLLQDVAKSPLFGCNAADFKDRLQDLCTLEGRAREAITARDKAFDSFKEFVRDNNCRVVGAYLDDLIVQYWDFM